jgi:hypothetical protein
VSRSTVTFERPSSVSRFVSMKRRSDDSETDSPRSSRRRWWIVETVTTGSQVLIWSRNGSISARLGWRNERSTSSGNHSTTRADH